jgi:hypothetical protein
MKNINVKLKLLMAVLVMICCVGNACSAEKLISNWITSMDKKDYIGKSILIGINIYNKDDKLIFSGQIAGKIIKMSGKRIDVLPDSSNKVFGLPPDSSVFEKATPGVYQLKNGNIQSLINPDFTVTYSIYAHDSPIDLKELTSLTNHGYIEP